MASAFHRVQSASTSLEFFVPHCRNLRSPSGSLPYGRGSDGLLSEAFTRGIWGHFGTSPKCPYFAPTRKSRWHRGHHAWITSLFFCCKLLQIVARPTFGTRVVLIPALAAMNSRAKDSGQLVQSFFFVPKCPILFHEHREILLGHQRPNRAVFLEKGNVNTTSGIFPGKRSPKRSEPPA